MENFSAQIRSDAVPDELQSYLHDDFRENESFYWKTRDSLIKKYRGRWIAIHQGKVITAGDDIFNVMQQVGKQKCHAYITKVGKEDQLVFKNRRIEFDYDTEYSEFALPQAHVIFSNFSQSASQKFEDVIPDTGSDGTGLPLDDCTAIQLFESPYILASSKGVGATGRVTPVFQGFAEINGLKCPALIQPLPRDKKDRLLGRDVLNQITTIFRGKENKVIFMKSRTR